VGFGQSGFSSDLNAGLPGFDAGGLFGNLLQAAPSIIGALRGGTAPFIGDVGFPSSPFTIPPISGPGVIPDIISMFQGGGNGDCGNFRQTRSGRTVPIPLVMCKNPATGKATFFGHLGEPKTFTRWSRRRTHTHRHVHTARRRKR